MTRKHVWEIRIGLVVLGLLLATMVTLVVRRWNQATSKISDFQTASVRSDKEGRSASADTPKPREDKLLHAMKTASDSPTFVTAKEPPHDSGDKHKSTKWRETAANYGGIPDAQADAAALVPPTLAPASDAQPIGGAATANPLSYSNSATQTASANPLRAAANSVPSTDAVPTAAVNYAAGQSNPSQSQGNSSAVIVVSGVSSDNPSTQSSATGSATNGSTADTMAPPFVPPATQSSGVASSSGASNANAPSSPYAASPYAQSNGGASAPYGQSQGGYSSNGASSGGQPASTSATTVAYPSSYPTSSPPPAAPPAMASASASPGYLPPAAAEGGNQSPVAPRNDRGRRDDGTYEVQPNDNFWIIAQKIYNNGAFYKALAEANRLKTAQSDKLSPGQIIATPAVADLRKNYPDLCPRPGRREAVHNHGGAMSQAGFAGGGRVYVVQEGDTLSSIAHYELGKITRWAEIYELNREAIGKEYNYLTPGMQLQMPPKEAAGDRVTRQPDDGGPY